MSDLVKYDISHELWREYEWEGRSKPYRIDNPLELFIRPGGTTHRVTSKIHGEIVAHCVPSVGEKGCVLRWGNKDSNPVHF